MILEWAAAMALLADVTRLLGIGTVADMPAIQRASAAELRALCGRCRALYARPVILLREDVDLGTDEGRSILVHELAHHAQAMTGRWGLAETCDMHRRRELEAYAIQNAWTAEHHGGRYYFYMAPGCAEGR